MSDTPNLDKLFAVQEDSQTIGQFLEWAENNGYQFAKAFTEKTQDFFGNDTLETHYVPVKIEDALADYFEIDLTKIDDERRAAIAYLRSKSICERGATPEETT